VGLPALKDQQNTPVQQNLADGERAFMLDLILIGAAIGIGGTIAMDIWAIVLNKAFRQPLPNWGNVGRWFWHLGQGKFSHSSIANAAPYANEAALGWFMHYAIGALYGVFVTLIGGKAWIDAPSFGIPLIVGLVTVGAGWFILQPGLGIGVAASKTPNPTKVRMLNIIAHVIFAMGMYGAALLIAA
jgi:hypothetical protein